MSWDVYESEIGRRGKPYLCIRTSLDKDFLVIAFLVTPCEFFIETRTKISRSFVSETMNKPGVFHFRFLIIYNLAEIKKRNVFETTSQNKHNCQLSIQLPVV